MKVQQKTKGIPKDALDRLMSLDLTVFSMDLPRRATDGATPARLSEFMCRLWIVLGVFSLENPRFFTDSLNLQVPKTIDGNPSMKLPEKDWEIRGSEFVPDGLQRGNRFARIVS